MLLAQRADYANHGGLRRRGRGAPRNPRERFAARVRNHARRGLSAPDGRRQGLRAEDADTGPLVSVSAGTTPRSATSGMLRGHRRRAGPGHLFHLPHHVKLKTNQNHGTPKNHQQPGRMPHALVGTIVLLHNR